MQLRWTSDQGVKVAPLNPLPGHTVAQAVWMSGLVPAPALCSGLGRCGTCRVRFVSKPPVPLPVELEVLGLHELARGVRLACRHAACEDMDIELEGVLPRTAHESWTTAPARLCGAIKLAVDLGTTSIHWKAFDDSGDISCTVSGKELNPQLGAGSEVMSRIGEALRAGGVQRLGALVGRRLADLSTAVGATELCIAGNTAMTSILLELDCTGLAAAPYKRPEPGGRTVRVPSCPDLPPVWIPPQPAPFVGGDVSAGLAAVLAGSPHFPFLLADMGTNGEFALMPDAKTLLLTSVPLGPSLEGIGLSRGVLAGPGAVTGFSLGPAGLVPQVMASESGNAACGISGTGYLSLLHVLRAQGVLDAFGIPATEPARLTPLGRRLLSGLTRAATGPWRLSFSSEITITATDVEELIKVRAAFSLAVARLLKAANMRPEGLSAVYLAGALGEHVSPDALEGLGFLPAGLGRRLICAGNTSLAGAELLLRQPELREPLAALCASARIVELAGRADFMPDYVERMRLTGFQI